MVNRGCIPPEAIEWQNRSYSLAEQILSRHFNGPAEVYRSRMMIRVNGLDIGIRNETASIAQRRRVQPLNIWLFSLLTTKRDFFLLMAYEDYTSAMPKKAWLIPYSAFNSDKSNPLYEKRYIILQEADLNDNPLAPYEINIS